MESSIQSPVVAEKFVPAYSLGKIHNKHLILEILGYCEKSRKLLCIMFQSSRNMRELLIKNFRIFKVITKLKPLGP